MKVAFGLKAHSGWAALVVIGERDGRLVVVDRRRVELVEDEWAKQPYHAAEDLRPDAAAKVVQGGIDAADRIAVREMRAAVKRERERRNNVTACAVLVGSPMPQWSVAEIIAVHFRMHKAEGVLFKDALLRAAGACGLKVLAIPEKELSKRAAQTLRTPMSGMVTKIAALGRSVGPPWGKDQKEAALAALIAMQRGTRRD